MHRNLPLFQPAPVKKYVFNIFWGTWNLPGKLGIYLHNQLGIFQKVISKMLPKQLPKRVISAGGRPLLLLNFRGSEIYKRPEL